MLGSIFEPEDPVDVSTQREIDNICDEFERQWKPGANANLEPLILRIEDRHRPRLLAELLNIISEKNEQDGRSAELSTYRTKLPDYEFVVDTVSRAKQASSVDSLSDASTDSFQISHLGTTTEERLPIGTRIGPYCLLDFLGGGSFGHVYRAKNYDSTEYDYCALKICRPHRATEENKEQVRKEGEILKGLSHPHIIKVYDVGIADEHQYLAGELIEGVTLEQEVKKGPMESAQAARVVKEIAEALSYFHKQGSVHRDVKPSNLLLDIDGKAYLADFGIAQTPSDFRLQKEYIGTPYYMSPEQVQRFGGTLDGRSDIFSLGVVLYECLTGRLPYRSKLPEDVEREILTVSAPPPSQLNSDVPPALDSICFKCLAKSPSDRYMNAGELAKALSKVSGKKKSRRNCKSLKEKSSGSIAFKLPSFSARVGLGMLFVLAVVILAAVFFFQTPHGTIRVEFEDPNIVIRSDGSDVVLMKGKKEEITLTPGNKKLTVDYKGVSFETDNVDLKAGEEVVVKVRHVEGKVQAVSNGKLLGSVTVDPEKPTGFSENRRVQIAKSSVMGYKDRDFAHSAGLFHEGMRGQVFETKIDEVQEKYHVRFDGQEMKEAWLKKSDLKDE